jgi:acetyl esterase/lipase
MMRNLVGGSPDDVPEMYDLASPIHHVTASCPPTLLFQGTHDAVVPLEAARRLHRALEAAGVPVVYVEYPWTEHAFDLMYPPLANPAAKTALHDLERFLACIPGEQRQHEPLPLSARRAGSVDGRRASVGPAVALPATPRSA